MIHIRNLNNDSFETINQCNFTNLDSIELITNKYENENLENLLKILNCNNKRLILTSNIYPKSKIEMEMLSLLLNRFESVDYSIEDCFDVRENKIKFLFKDKKTFLQNISIVLQAIDYIKGSIELTGKVDFIHYYLCLLNDEQILRIKGLAIKFFNLKGSFECKFDFDFYLPNIMSIECDCLNSIKNFIYINPSLKRITLTNLGKNSDLSLLFSFQEIIMEHIGEHTKIRPKFLNFFIANHLQFKRLLFLDLETEIYKEELITKLCELNKNRESGSIFIRVKIDMDNADPVKEEFTKYLDVINAFEIRGV